MGYQSLSSAIAWLTGLLAAGFLLDAYCPDPRTLPEAVQAQWQAALAGEGPLPAAYAHAHYLWYVFAVVGFSAFLALLTFKYITAAIDRRRAVRGAAP
jgi:hypothetical protein